MEIWEDDEFDLELAVEINAAAKEAFTAAQETKACTPLLQLYLFFLFMFQTLFRLSDNALDVLLRFLAMFFKSFGERVAPLPSSFVDALPSSIYSARKMAGSERDRFDRYVCCPGCHSLYSLDECVVRMPGGHLESKRCSYIQFPLHPQRQHRKACGTLVMKKVKRTSKGASLYPKLVYCYKSVIDSLQDMLKRPDFFRKCELWRDRQVHPGVYSDVYDGAVWKEFLIYNGTPFLSAPYNYAFQLNVDWFKPFKHTQHSEGAVYLSIMNLPRKERFLQENIILACVIPGPHEPSLLMNSLLNPLVKELKKLWRGVILKDCNNHPVIVRAALLCCSCDVPASRKVCGFVGHGACKGCSKCLLSFPTRSFGEKADYSNFDKSQWKPRTNEQHRNIADQYRSCKTRAAQIDIEREFGIRYTILLELPYFDVPRMCVIDPMHNLLLGTAKSITELWKSSSLLSSKHFDVIQEKVDSFIAPADIGRLPMKISSGFSGFTAEQWKNWVIFYSLFALKDVLPWQHYNCWHLFVKVCFLLCRRTITYAQLQEADHFLEDFWKAYKQLYGTEACTPNTHLHGHLTACIQDFGPVYSFWCFAYERMNGVLGAYHTNNHHVSVQYMHRFLDSKSYAPIYWPQEFTAEYLPLLQRSVYLRGSLMQSNLETEITDQKFTPLPPVQEFALSSSHKVQLQPYFEQRLSGESFVVLTLCRRTKALAVGDFVLGAKGSRHSQSSLVLAECSQTGERVALAEIQYFMECIAIPDNDHIQGVSLWIACVNWFLEHPCKVWYGNPVQVWTFSWFFSHSCEEHQVSPCLCEVY